MSSPLLRRRQLEDLLVEFSHCLHARGWVANHDGNITARSGDVFLSTPTSFSKAAISRENLLLVNEKGERQSGSGKPFSELELHLFIYRQRPDVQVVIHAHPPTATGLAVAGVALRPAMLAEPVVSLGDRIPLIAYARPRTPAATLNLVPHIQHCDVVLLENHGVLSMGPDVETAYLRMELAEHLARIQLVAMQAGGVREIPQEDVAALLEARAKAGLGARKH